MFVGFRGSRVRPASGPVALIGIATVPTCHNCVALHAALEKYDLVGKVPEIRLGTDRAFDRLVSHAGAPGTPALIGLRADGSPVMVAAGAQEVLRAVNAWRGSES